MHAYLIYNILVVMIEVKLNNQDMVEQGVTEFDTYIVELETYIYLNHVV